MATEKELATAKLRGAEDRAHKCQMRPGHYDGALKQFVIYEMGSDLWWAYYSGYQEALSDAYYTSLDELRRVTGAGGLDKS